MATYEDWSREDLISRIRKLEAQSPTSEKPANLDIYPAGKKQNVHKPFDFSKHPRRKIALRFCYFGWEYNGLAFQNEPTPLPTVEGALLDALGETRLIDPAKGMDGCGWSRCGRTDRGVSAAGQVVALYIRSALRHNSIAAPHDLPPDSSGIAPTTLSHPASDKNEINYVDVLNRVLPPGIRILAWSPVSEGFDARFSCIYRHYKYFFDTTNLDLESMKDAIQRLEGEHDFRNLCKVDASKQIVNYRRLIKRASITSLGDGGMNVVDIVGNGFLYHQVRHILAVLFLVGAGFEKPSIIDALVNTNNGIPVHPALPEAASPGEENIPIVDRMPDYQMADGLPLVLWDCGFQDGDVAWRCDSLSASHGKSDMRDVSNGPAGLVNHLRAMNHRTRIEATIQRHFLQTAESHADPDALMPPGAVRLHSKKGSPIFHIPLGAGTYKRTGKYVPLLERDRKDSVEVVNARWLATKGARRAQRTQETSEVSASQTIAMPPSP
jgi:tRNA pseudouridine38/39 synthase